MFFLNSFSLIFDRRKVISRLVLPNRKEGLCHMVLYYVGVRRFLFFFYLTDGRCANEIQVVGEA